MWTPDHPLSPETAAWLETLKPRDRLVALIAMQLTFKFLHDDPDWDARIEAAKGKLRPRKGELETIVAEAHRAARQAAPVQPTGSPGGFQPAATKLSKVSRASSGK